MQYPKGYPTVCGFRSALRAISASGILLVFLSACNASDKLPTTATDPDMTVWSTTESPFLPTSWPPASDTVWVRYTFAYGMNPAELMDGNFVTGPLSKTEWKAGTPTTTVLSDEMTQAAIQGVLPIDNQTRLVLDTEAEVSAFCLGLRELPDPNAPETRGMIAYYSAWFTYNGAFLALVREDHAKFVDWIKANQ